MKIVEKEINAPWGSIALKLWGDESDPAVVTVHGILDNAGGFDRIIPLLPQSYYYICVDLPGHGKSSHFPPHLPIHSINNLIVYTLVMDYFNKNKYIIMGHSYGGQLGYLFAQLHPHRVEKLIMFDAVKLLPVPVNSFQDYLVSKFKVYFEIEQKLKSGSPPLYTYEEAMQRVIQGHSPPLSREAAVGLLNRILIPKDNGKYELSLDQRLKNFFNPLHGFTYSVQCSKQFPVLCPILIVVAEDNEVQRTFMKPIVEVFQNQANITVKYIKGHHDVHNQNPELVAPHVVEFLIKQKHKL